MWRLPCPEVHESGDWGQFELWLWILVRQCRPASLVRRQGEQVQEHRAVSSGVPSRQSQNVKDSHGTLVSDSQGQIPHLQLRSSEILG